MKLAIVKYVTALFFLVSVGCIFAGYFLETENSEKLIGFGVLGLFFIVFPLFSWFRWRNKNVKDYLLTKENLEKMRKRESEKY